MHISSKTIHKDLKNRVIVPCVSPLIQSSGASIEYDYKLAGMSTFWINNDISSVLSDSVLQLATYHNWHTIGKTTAFQEDQASTSSILL